MLTCKLTCMQLKDIERLTNIELKYSCYRRDQQSSSVSITFISLFPYEVFKSTHIIWASKILRVWQRIDLLIIPKFKYCLAWCSFTERDLNSLADSADHRFRPSISRNQWSAMFWKSLFNQWCLLKLINRLHTLQVSDLVHAFPVSSTMTPQCLLQSYSRSAKKEKFFF